MNLEAITLQKLTVLELPQFITRFQNNVKNQGIDITTDADFQELYNSLTAQVAQFETATKPIKNQSISEKLFQLDDARDKKIVTLRRVWRVAEHSDEPAEQNAYALLRSIFESYRDLENLNYEAETAGIKKMIAEFRKNTYQSAATLLGLDKCLTHLEQANLAFDETFSQRATEIINTPVYDTKALRKTLEDTYKETANYVLTMAQRRKNTNYYTDLLLALNNGRKHFADLLARRNGGHTPLPTPPPAQ